MPSVKIEFANNIIPWEYLCLLLCRPLLAVLLGEQTDQIAH